MRLRGKLIVLALVPFLFLLFFAGRMILEQARQAQEMRAVTELARVAAEIGALVHEMQKERGMSAGFVGSRGASFGEELRAQRAEVDRRHSQLREKLVEFAAEGIAAGLRQRLDEAARQLADLPAKRQAVSALTIGGGDVIAYYSKAIGSLLSAIGQAATLAHDPQVVQAASAYNALLRAKEYAGMERATLSNVFASDHFSPEMMVRFLSIAAAQQTWFDAFALYASSDQAAYLASKVSGNAVDEVARIKQAATANLLSPSLGTDAKLWFARATDRINLVKAVEDRLAADLVTLAEHELASAKRRMLLVLGLTLMAALLTAAIGWRQIRHIVQQIGGEPADAALIARRIADGNLTDEIAVVPGDRDSLLAAMRTMHDKLSHILVSIERSGKQMGQSAFQVSTISQSIAEVSRQERTRSADVAAATALLRSIAEGVLSRVELAADKTREVEQTGQEGVAAVERNIAELAQATAQVDRAATEVSELTKAAAQITSIIGSIREIAEQTNLLALNAAIEAARAGEQGRGFAVVADEVRKLAERTASSSLQVSEIAGAVSSRVGQLREAMTEVVRRVDESRGVAAETAKAIRSMASGVSEVACGDDAIATDSRRQMTQLLQLDGSLQALFATLEESATKVEATAIIGTDLHEVACHLNELMSGFSFRHESSIARRARDERRLHPRLERGLLVRLTGDDGSTQDCLTEDLSLSGARLLLTRPPPQARVGLAFCLPQTSLEEYRSQEPLNVQAEIRWTRPHGDRYQCGLEFVDLSAAKRDQLRTVFAYYDEA